MGKSLPKNALTYPVTIRKIEDYLVVSVNDWQISLAFQWTDGEPYTPHTRAQLTNAIEKCWLKVAESMRLRMKAGIMFPEPSKIALATEKEKKKGRQIKPLTVSEVAKILSISENSVRRIPRDLLRPRFSRGGHRRYSTGAVLNYQSLFSWQDEKPQDLLNEKSFAQKSLDV